MAAAVPLSPVEMKTAMTNNDAIRILQHAAFYIFSSRVVGGPGRRMRGTVDLWQAMATLDRCRRELLQMPITMRGARAADCAILPEHRRDVLAIAVFGRDQHLCYTSLTFNSTRTFEHGPA